MDIQPLGIAGAFHIILDPKQDQRGYFLRAYDQATFARHGLVTSWVQENEAMSVQKGIVRGLHFQCPPHAETKLVRVTQGTVLDAFVDIRRGSPTYGKWATVELSAAKHNAVYIPKGCAHGYCTLTDVSLVLYKVDSSYTPQAEGGLRWNDKDLGIPWPLTDAIVSQKDAALPSFRDFVTPFE